MSDRNPTLAGLDVLIGHWTLRIPGVEGTAWTDFTWTDDGLFLRQISDADPLPPEAPQEWRDNVPFPTTCLMGLDDATNEFTMLYADARGVHRVYSMTFSNGLWTLLRKAPGFNQRFTGRLGQDTNTIDAQWEMSEDGSTWNLDFKLTYTRQL